MGTAGIRPCAPGGRPGAEAAAAQIDVLAQAMLTHHELRKVGVAGPGNASSQGQGGCGQCLQDGVAWELSVAGTGKEGEVKRLVAMRLSFMAPLGSGRSTLLRRLVMSM